MASRAPSARRRDAAPVQFEANSEALKEAQESKKRFGSGNSIADRSIL